MMPVAAPPPPSTMPPMTAITTITAVLSGLSSAEVSEGGVVLFGAEGATVGSVLGLVEGVVGSVSPVALFNTLPQMVQI